MKVEVHSAVWPQSSVASQVIVTSPPQKKGGSAFGGLAAGIFSNISDGDFAATEIGSGEVAQVGSYSIAAAVVTESTDPLVEGCIHCILRQAGFQCLIRRTGDSQLGCRHHHKGGNTFGGLAAVVRGFVGTSCVRQDSSV
eukprot:TRINITY_DN3385_c0_g1_i14.p2 TRINITY_DN3385_c0_g1~~TRINITY_DN3385_c0_g1_i14.p2  ORF type:complete len:140 (-),score=13.25 TRINITY_DN3385_c0_g1_i14:199-618(-)